MTCVECQRLTEAKENYWQTYRRQKHLSNSGRFKELKSTEEIDDLLEKYKIASASLRYHLAIKHTHEGHRVSHADIELLSDDDDPVSC